MRKVSKDLCRRGLSLFLTLVMCLSMLQLTVLAADDSPDPVGGGNHVHNSEGWICTPYCDIPEHVHTGECYAMVDKEEEEEEVNIPVNLPGDFPVNDGSSTEKDDFGNPYEQPEYIGPDLNGDPGEGEDPGFLVDPEDPDGADVPEGGPGAQPEGPGDEPTTQPEEGGEPSTQPEEGGEPTTQPEEGGEPSTQPEEGGESVTQPGEDKGTSGEAGENKTEESIGAGEEITDEDPPRSPVPELQCGLEEHHHTKDCTEGEDGGWICEPDTNITINVPENGLVDGRVDLLDGVSATPARCGNWVVQIAVSSVKTADGTELEPEDGQYLEAQEGVIYTVEYAAYVDAAMTADGNSAPVDSIPEGILATQTRTVEGEGVGGAAKMGDAWYDTLQAAIDAVPADQAGTVITLFADVNENIVSNGASYTLDMKGHVLHSGVVGKNVFTVMGGTVTIQNGIITGGDYGDRTNQDGKGLLVNGADVTLENCEIKDNKGCGKKGTTPGYQGGQGGLGGGVYAYNGSLTLIDCTVSENKSSSKGGGIYAENCDVTVTNSKVLDNTTGGGAPSGGGILVSSGSLTIDGATISGNVASNGNGNAIALTGKIENVTIKNSEISSTASGIASVIYADYGTGPINLDLENVDVVNKAAANTTNAIYSGLAGTFTAKDCTFHDSNGRIYFPKATEMSFTNCQFLNNDASYSSAIAPVYLESGNASFTDCTFTGNKGYTAGALYNKSKGAVTINGCLFTQNNATTYTAAGALYVKEETNTTVTDTVVKENQTSGTNSSGPAGGISVNGASGKTTTFTMTSGAVYNNKSEKTNAHDLYVDSRATISILAAKDMTDGDVDFSSYAWSDLTRTVIENELTQGGTWVATPAPEYAASINETKYKTLDEAFEAAWKQSRETGENVTVEVAEGYIPLSTYYSVTSGAHPASVTLHLNNTKIYGVGISNSFSVDKDNTLTLSGTGTLNKKIYMMGGTLNIDGNVVVSGGSLSFGQAPIYDKNDKNCKSQININGNVKLVQTALYGGAVTVGKDAHVEKLEASLTNSSGISLETSFVLNGTVDNLILNPRTARSTAALNGHVGTLTLSQGTNMYDSPRTTPIIKAGENFSADKIEISPALGSAKSYDEETGKDSTGLISIYALQNPTQKFDDQVLIYGGGSYASNTTWTTSMSNKHTDGKDYKFLTTVENVDGNIVLHKTVVGGGNYILLDGVNGDDTQNGDTLSTAVKTFARAKELLNNNIKVIHVLGTVTVSGNETWSLDEGYRLESFPTCKDTLVKVTGSLTLSNVVIDGKDITRTSPLIENRGTLNIEAGTEIKGGVNTVIYGPNNGSGIDGGAVYNSGTLNMTGGSITGNSARTGAGVFSKGTFSLSGGDISNNTGYGGRFAYSYGSSSKVNSAPAGGGVFLAGSSTMNMSGGTIANNTVAEGVGGGIALGNETNAYVSYGGPKLFMTNGTISGNTAKQGGGIFIQEMCEATISCGSIIGNTATGGFSTASNAQIYYAGGGIYVNGGTGMTKQDGKLYLENAAITGNEAGLNGGGIAGCPSANVSVKLDDGGVIAGNTGAGKEAYDVYINRIPIIGTVPGSGHGGGVHFDLSKYMMGGALYKWHSWETKEPIIYQDASDIVYSYKGHNDAGFYSGADPAVISDAASKCSVIISGNISKGSGGGIGTNGEVHIGKDPNLNDFFDVIVHKNWLNEKGEPMNKNELAELRKEITSITLQLYRRVVGTEKWELVDNRLLKPGEDNFWEMDRPFTKLLKQLDGEPLEYQVVEEIRVTGDVWGEANGGIIQLVTPPIREGDGSVEATGTAERVDTIPMDWTFNGNSLTDEELGKITSITVQVFKNGEEVPVAKAEWLEKTDSDTTTAPDENGSMEAGAIVYDSGDSSSAEGKPAVIIKDKRSVIIKNLEAGKYTVKSVGKGELGLEATCENTITSDGSKIDVAQGSLTNQVNAPSLILVKKIDGESLAGQTFKFTIKYTTTDLDENGNPKMAELKRELTIPKDGTTTGSITLAWATDLADAKIGGTFTVTEEKGSWNPNWSVENAMGTPGDAGLTATGTLCYGENTVTFTNYEPSKVPIPVKKLISGDTPKEIPTFQFELSVDPELKQEGFVMPENTTLTLGSSDFGSGKEAFGVFDAIKFSEEGIYKFTVKETSKDADGWTFDSTEWTVTIKALLKDGKLEAKIDCVEAENKTPVSSPEFTNTYEGGKLTIKKVVSGGGSEAQSKEYCFTVTGPNDYSQIVKISGANGWAQTLTGLTPGVYTVKEDDASISGYNWTATGSGVVTANVEAKKTAEVTITNTYDTQTITTTLEVIKVWNDDNSPARPGSILVSLSNSQGIQGYATLSDANNWRHEWTGLDASETWTADEVGVPDGYTSSKTQDGNVVTITNTPTAPPPPGNPPRNPPGTPPRVPELPDPNIPGAPEEVTVVDEDVPLTYVKTWDPEEEEYVYVPEEEVPLADVTPETGDTTASALWTALCLTSAAGLCALHITRPRKKEELN